MKKPMILTLILILQSAFALAAQPVAKAKTLNCQVKYTYVKKDGSEQHDTLPAISIKLARDSSPPGINRFVNGARQTTADGRFLIGVGAIQPLKGDMVKFEVAWIEVADLQNKILMSPKEGLPWVTKERADHPRLNISQYHGKDDKDYSSYYYLNAACDLN